MTTRRIAPWPDYAGNVIREGDTIAHPVTSDRGTVVLDESYANDSGKWRVRYEDGPDGTMALVLQIGERGMAVVVSDPPPQPAVIVPADELAALKDDAERFEWMLSSEARCYPLAIGEFGVVDYLDEMARGPTAREAIDRARSAK